MEVDGRVLIHRLIDIADGLPEVLKRVRENLMQGATQIKLMAGGGSFDMPS